LHGGSEWECASQGGMAHSLHRTFDKMILVFESRKHMHTVV
jgi:hypothetical protein